MRWVRCPSSVSPNYYVDKMRRRLHHFLDLGEAGERRWINATVLLYSYITYHHAGEARSDKHSSV
jgi:hypothetical protein